MERYNNYVGIIRFSSVFFSIYMLLVTFAYYFVLHYFTFTVLFIPKESCPMGICFCLNISCAKTI